ncbi:class I adenylate-forming enzyme family protein [Sorangium cellulosum]|uniref:class I adenylate-forming enzyme family protein n=1 Tax=Sorangium cellulosum TaxID=56 RepID=UPI001331C320|nr:fatty acid--CoA ligase family protein [Sorangium cellulosum]
MSDGTLQVDWATIDSALAAIEAFLGEHGIAADDMLALESVNSVPGALTLLALLSRGASFAFLPAPGPTAPAQPLPRFLRHRISVRSPLAEGRRGPVSLLRPETFLELRAVEDHRPLPEGSPLRRGRLLLRTSGSLDSPKLVVHTHEGLLGNALNAVERLALDVADRVLIPVPLAHMYGLGAGFLPAMSVGASVELLEGANLLRYMERERSFRPTVAFLSPNLCAMLLRPRDALGHYRHVVVAGDKLSPEAFEKAEALFRRVVNLYGSTEMGVICAADARETEGPRATTVGRPLPGVTLHLEPQPGSAEGDGSPGDLFCAHPYGFEGYVDSDGEPLSRAADAQAGGYATRDLGRLHPDGLLEVLGRGDHAVKRDGRLVMLAEVERALERLAGVERAAVVVAGETRRGRGIVAFCTPRAGVEIEPGGLRRACQGALPAYAVPDEICLLPSLPLLPSGKLDRRALQRAAPAPHSPHEASPDHGHRQS